MEFLFETGDFPNIFVDLVVIGWIKAISYVSNG